MRTFLESLVAFAAVLVNATLWSFAGPYLGSFSTTVSFCTGMLVGAIGAATVVHRHFERKWAHDDPQP